MADSLNPAALTRLLHGRRPDWTRTVAARRATAAGLVALAAVSALRDDPRGDTVDVVVAARDLAPGAALTADDVRVQPRPAATAPDSAATGLDTVVGATLAGPTRRGEVLTDVRLLSPRLAEAAAGPDARLVALPLADPALLDLVRVGDVVDVVAAPQSADAAEQARVLTTGAVVVLVSGEQKGLAARSGSRVVLVALPAAAARAVAGAALAQSVTLTLH
jgi:Flp pilus assembly protein CpaB